MLPMECPPPPQNIAVNELSVHNIAGAYHNYSTTNIKNISVIGGERNGIERESLADV